MENKTKISDDSSDENLQENGSISSVNIDEPKETSKKVNDIKKSAKSQLDII